MPEGGQTPNCLPRELGNALNGHSGKIDSPAMRFPALPCCATPLWRGGENEGIDQPFEGKRWRIAPRVPIVGRITVWL